MCPDRTGPGSLPGRTSHYRRAATATLVAAWLAAPAGAAAQAAAGGASAGEPPVIAGVACRVACAGIDRAAAGSVVRLTGSGMAGATAVVFLGGPGRRDDVTQPVQAAEEAAVDVAVPPAARSGRLRVVGAFGLSPQGTQRLAIGAAAAGAPVLQARVDRKRVFLAGRSAATLSYFVGGDAPADVRVDLVRDGDPAPVATWTPGTVTPGTVQSVTWDAPLAGAAPPEGRYEFHVSVAGAPAPAPAGGAAPRAAQAEPGATSGFLLLGHAFPVRGPHEIGMDPLQRFGASRAGHVHEGQDVFAACGTPLVAVRGGVVRFRATQAAAGNYVVIRGDDGADYAYMHLQAPALLARGTPVATGQVLGLVGDTGDAHGCHLHFEKWPAPGWYSGGSPADPLPDLLAWDKTS